MLPNSKRLHVQPLCLMLLLLCILGATQTAAQQEPGDDDGQRAALVDIYKATNGAQWQIPQLQPSKTSPLLVTPWLSSGSYCRWFGVSCCSNSPLSLVECANATSVVALNLEGLGLQGSIPQAVSSLPDLHVLNLGDNPNLSGTLPSVTSLLWLSVLNTSLVACQGDGKRPQPAQLPASSCQPTPGLSLGTQSQGGQSAVLCPPVLLTSFMDYARDLPPSLVDKLTLPFPQPSVPGAVLADAGFSNMYGCQCRGGSKLQVGDGGVLECEGKGGGSKKGGWIAAIVVVAIVPQLLFALSIYVFLRHKAAIHALVRSKEEELQRKRGKVPGTPGIALQDGRGVLALADIMVTWVCTDVASSTRLWEWNPDCMDVSIDLHNRELRALLDELGGHEIRNEGDSFVISFHDALDGITFCLKAQERLMQLPWPPELKNHPAGARVCVGDLINSTSSHAAGTGALVMAGLRVRMGINTGVPDDVFLHDVTEHVDYRGIEYDLAGEICDLACGGQILMGPKTFQRWNKQETAQPDPLLGFGPVLPEAGGWREMTQSFLNPSTRSRLGIGGPASMSFRNTLLRRQLGQESTAASGTFAVMDPSGNAMQQPSLEDSPSMTHAGQRDSATSETPISPKHGAGRLRMSFSDRYGTSYTEPQALRGSPGESPHLHILEVEQAGPSSCPHPLRHSAVKPPGGQAAAAAAGYRELGVAGMASNNSSGRMGPAGSRLSEGLKSTGLAMSRFFWSFANSGQHKDAAQVARQATTSSPGVPTLAPLQGEQLPTVNTRPLSRLYRAASDGLPSPHDTSPVAAGVQASASLSRNSNAGNHMSVSAAGQRASAPTKIVSFAHDSQIDWADRNTADELVQNVLVGHVNPLFQARYQPDRPDTLQPSGTNVTSSNRPTHEGTSAATRPSSSQLRQSNATNPPTWENLHEKSVISLATSMRRGSANPLMASQAIDTHSPNAMLLIESAGSGGLDVFTGACSALLRQLLSRCLACMHLATSGPDGDAGWDSDAQRPSNAAARSTSSYKGAVNKGLVIDMGYWNWKQWQPTEQEAPQGRVPQDAQSSKFIHLVQVVPASLAPRALVFDWPLSPGQDRWDKISPGFFDAPGSSCLIFPAMRELMSSAEMGNSRPIVCIAFSSVEGFREMSALNMDMARDMLQLHNACVRETLSACNGYECKEFNGSFMTAFSDACAAVEWALTLQLALMHVAWARELMACHELAAEVWDEESHRVIFRGFRSRVGIYSGSIDRVTPHVKSGRADYFGPPVNRAARLMSAASGGQIVCDRALMDTVAEEWSKRYNVKREIEEPYSVQPGTQSVSYGQRINSQTGPNTPGHIAGRLASLLAGTRTSSQDAESMRSAVLNAVRGPGSNSEAPAGPALRLAVRQQSGRIRSLTSGGMNSPLGSDRLLPVSRTADNSVSSPQESRLARSFVGTSFSKLRLHSTLGHRQGSTGEGSFNDAERSLQRTPRAGSTTTAATGDSTAHADGRPAGSLTSQPSVVRQSHEDPGSPVTVPGRSQTAGGALGAGLSASGGSTPNINQLTTKAVQRLNEMELRAPSAPALGPTQSATLVAGGAAVPASVQLQSWDPALRMRSTNRGRRNSSSSTASVRSHMLPVRTASNRSLRSTLSNPHSHTASSVHIRVPSNVAASPHSTILSPASTLGPLSPVMTLPIRTSTRGGTQLSPGPASGHLSPKSAKSTGGGSGGAAAGLPSRPGSAGGAGSSRSAAATFSGHASDFGATDAAQPERHLPQPSRLSVPGLRGAGLIPAGASAPLHSSQEAHDEPHARFSDRLRATHPAHQSSECLRTSDADAGRPSPGLREDAHTDVLQHFPSRTTLGAMEEEGEGATTSAHSMRPPTIHTVPSANFRTSDMSAVYAQIPASPGGLTRASTETSQHTSNRTSNRTFHKELNNSMGSNVTSHTHTTHPPPTSHGLTTTNSRTSHGAASTGLMSSRSYQLMVNNSLPSPASSLQMSNTLLPEAQSLDRSATPHLIHSGSGHAADLLNSPRSGPHEPGSTQHDAPIVSAFATMAHEPLTSSPPIVVTPMEPMQPPAARDTHVAASPRTRSGRMSFAGSFKAIQSAMSGRLTDSQSLGAAMPTGASATSSGSVNSPRHAASTSGVSGAARQTASFELPAKHPGQLQNFRVMHGVRAPIPRLSVAIPDEYPSSSARSPASEPTVDQAQPPAHVVQSPASPSDVYERLNSQQEEESNLKGAASATSGGPGGFPGVPSPRGGDGSSLGYDRKSPSLRSRQPSGTSTSTLQLQHAHTAASLPPAGSAASAILAAQQATRRMSLFIVGSDDQPMVIKYGGQSNNGGALHPLLHSPLNVSSGMLSSHREDSSAERAGIPSSPGPSGAGAPPAAVQQAGAGSPRRPGSGRAHRRSTSSYAPGLLLGSPGTAAGGGVVRVPPWEVGNMSMKERSSNQHIDGFPNTPRSGGAVINGLARKRSVAVSSMVESGKLRPPSSRGTREGASSVAGTTAAGPNSGANSGTAPADAADKDLEQTVIAECFKIMPQAAAAGPERTIGSAGPAGGSITMIKYTNLKEQAQRAGEIEEELPPLEEDEPLLPTNTTIIPTVPVEVAVWGLGSYRLKGVTELMRVVQVLPVALERRMDHLPRGALNRGKARCIQRNVARVERITINLPDVTKLSCTSLLAGDEPPPVVTAPNVFGHSSNPLTDAHNSNNAGTSNNAQTTPASSTAPPASSLHGDARNSVGRASQLGSPSGAAQGPPPLPAGSIPLHLLLLQHHEEAVAQGVASPSSLTVPPALLAAPGASVPGMPIRPPTSLAGPGGLSVVPAARGRSTPFNNLEDLGLGEEGLAPISESVTPSHSITSMQHAGSSHLGTAGQRSNFASRSTALSGDPSGLSVSSSRDGDAPSRLSAARPAELQLPTSPDGGGYSSHGTGANKGTGSSVQHPLGSSSASGYPTTHHTLHADPATQQQHSRLVRTSSMGAAPSGPGYAHDGADRRSGPSGLLTHGQLPHMDPSAPSEAAGQAGTLPPMAALAYLTAIQESQAHQRTTAGSAAGSLDPTSERASYQRTNTAGSPSTMSLVQALGITPGSVHSDLQSSSRISLEPASARASNARPMPTPAALSSQPEAGGAPCSHPGSAPAPSSPITPRHTHTTGAAGNLSTLSPLGPAHLLPSGAGSGRLSRGVSPRTSHQPRAAHSGAGSTEGGSMLQSHSSRLGSWEGGEHGAVLDAFFRTASREDGMTTTRSSAQAAYTTGATAGSATRSSCKLSREHVAVGLTSGEVSDAVEAHAPSAGNTSRTAGEGTALSGGGSAVAYEGQAPVSGGSAAQLTHATALQLALGQDQVLSHTQLLAGHPPTAGSHPASPRPPHPGSPFAQASQRRVAAAQVQAGPRLSGTSAATTSTRTSRGSSVSTSQPADSPPHSSGRSRIFTMPTFGSGQLRGLSTRGLDVVDNASMSSRGARGSAGSMGMTSSSAEHRVSPFPMSRMMSSEAPVVSLSGTGTVPEARSGVSGAAAEAAAAIVQQQPARNGSIADTASVCFSVQQEAPELSMSASDLLGFFMQPGSAQQQGNRGQGPPPA